MQWIKFDLSNDEHIADAPKARGVHHEYEDAVQPPPKVLCHSVNEILAEKTRLLAAPALQPFPTAQGVSEPRVFFPTRRWSEPTSSLDVVRYAARNRLLVELNYQGALRVAEPSRSAAQPPAAFCSTHGK